MNETKQFMVVSNVKNGESISWDVIRVGHKTKGDYRLAEIFDRGSVQLFITALEAKGFTRIEEVK